MIGQVVGILENFAQRWKLGEHWDPNERNAYNEKTKWFAFRFWNFERTDIVINKRPMGHIANLSNMRHNRISFMKSCIKYWDNEWEKKTLSSKFLQMFLCIVPFVTWWFHSFITYWVLSFYILKIFLFIFICKIRLSPQLRPHPTQGSWFKQMESTQVTAFLVHGF